MAATFSHWRRLAVLLSAQALSNVSTITSTREVRCSLTWHSSESESALKRFEPVAMAMLRLDGWGTLFAPEGDGCLQRAKRENAGRFSKEGKSLDDFWYFSSLKSTIRKSIFMVLAGRRRRRPLQAKI